MLWLSILQAFSHQVAMKRGAGRKSVKKNAGDGSVANVNVGSVRKENTIIIYMAISHKKKNILTNKLPYENNEIFISGHDGSYVCNLHSLWR